MKKNKDNILDKKTKYGLKLPIKQKVKLFNYLVMDINKIKEIYK